MLFNIMPLSNKDAMAIAANLELPLILRIQAPQSENKNTVKTEYILKNGSHHGHGLGVLFAYKFNNYCNQTLSSSEMVKAIRSGNFPILAQTPGNIGAILEYLPENCDASRMLRLTFGEEACCKAKNNVFAYFAKSNDKVELKEITQSHILIAEIFDMLQRCNRIEASDKLAEKINYVLSGSKTNEAN